MSDRPYGWIYGLHAGDGVIRYVGATIVGIPARMSQHRTQAVRGKYPVNRWMRKHGRYNIQVIEVAVAFDRASLDELEIEWIAKLRETNDLVNINRGGLGAVGWVHTQEWKDHMSVVNRGREVSAETRALMSAAKIGKRPNRTYWPPLTEERKAVIGAFHRGRKKPEGFGEAVSARVRGENHARAQLTDAQVSEVIALIASGVHDGLIASRFSVSERTIGKIRRGESWLHIERPWSEIPRLWGLAAA